MHIRFLIGLVLLLFLTSCGLFKGKKAPERPAPPDRKEVPAEKKEEKREKEEEVADEPADTTTVAPEVEEEPVLDQTLNISVFFPFGDQEPKTVQKVVEPANRTGSDSLKTDTIQWTRKQEAVIAFYLGFKLGVEELVKQGIDVEVDVVNTSKWSGGTREFLDDDDLSSADAWIGGYDVEQLKTLSAESAARSAMFISPFLTTSYFVESNPYYFQMKPSFEMHCRAIAEETRQLYDPKQVTVVLKEDKKSRMEYFRDSLEQDTANEFNCLAFPSHAEIENWTVEDHIQAGDTAVFILPMYREKGFIYTFLSHLSLGVPDESHIVIYGVPPLDRLELLYEFFNRFTVRMSSAHYEYSANPYRLQSFVEQYANRFGTLPLDESWEGYDLALFLGTAFKQHGAPLTKHIQDFYMQGLSMEFDPIPEKREDRSLFDLKHRPKYFQNAGVHILEFRNDAFRLVPGK